MKKIILLLLTSFYTQAQENNFSFSDKGFTDYIVMNCEGKHKEEIFNKTKDWISVTFNNPKEVIKAEINKEYIRIQGTKDNVLLGTFMGLNTIQNYRYQIEISIKDEKYKFDVIEIETFTPATKYTIGAWSQFNTSDIGTYYKNGKIRPSFKYLPITIPEMFNSLNDSLNKYILENKSNTVKNDW